MEKIEQIHQIYLAEVLPESWKSQLIGSGVKRLKTLTILSTILGP